MTREGERDRQRHLEENYVKDPAAYRALLESAGFNSIDVVDVTEPCWHGYYWHWVEYFHRAYLERRIGLDKLKEYLSGNYQRVSILTHYLLASAGKA